MSRAVVPKPVLDTLIRAKLASVGACAGVNPLPVAFLPGANGTGCNWIVPGWTGDVERARDCSERLGPYLDLLKSQFNIADEAPSR